MNGLAVITGIIGLASFGLFLWVALTKTPRDTVYFKELMEQCLK